MAPATPHYPVLFYAPGHGPVSPEFAQQVLWTVQELGSEELVAIQKKDGYPHIFDWDASPQFIRANDPQFNSGLPLRPTGMTRQTRAWVYSVTLTSPRLRAPIVLDPVVIIEPTP